MERVLEKNKVTEETITVYDNLKTLEIVNEYFLQRAMELCPRGQVLDVGCGTGRILRMMPDKYETHGVDVDERMIERARRCDNSTHYKSGDSNTLPYDDMTFDLVMSHSLLHHLENPRRTIEEILRVAKPDGAILIRDLCRPSSEYILQRYFVGFLASHYDAANKKLFEDSLRSGFTYHEWKEYMPECLDTSKAFFYNIAERAAKGVKIDLIVKKLKEIEFVQRRMIDPLIHE